MISNKIVVLAVNCLILRPEAASRTSQFLRFFCKFNAVPTIYRNFPYICRVEGFSNKTKTMESKEPLLNFVEVPISTFYAGIVSIALVIFLGQYFNEWPLIHPSLTRFTFKKSF